MKKLLLLLFTVVFLTSISQAQDDCGLNAGFELGNTTGWVCKYGYYGKGCPVWVGSCPAFGFVFDSIGCINANGINAMLASYSQNGRGEHHVAIKSDGSIRPTTGMYWHSYELTWRMYCNQAGKEFTTKLCKILNMLGMQVNTSCGFHCHVDGNDSTVESMKSLYNLCYKYENIIAGFIPPGSRGRDYAKLRGTSDRTLLDRARSISDIMVAANDRRFGLNLQAYSKDNRKTIEFRYHSPTTDGEKVWYWAMLCLRMYEHSRARACNSKTKLPNNAANLRNFLCAIGLKPNNKIYTSIDNRLKDVRDYLIIRWWKFERATRTEIATRRAERAQARTMTPPPAGTQGQTEAIPRTRSQATSTVTGQVVRTCRNCEHRNSDGPDMCTNYTNGVCHSGPTDEGNNGTRAFAMWSQAQNVEVA